MKFYQIVMVYLIILSLFFCFLIFVIVPDIDKHRQKKNEQEIFIVNGCKITKVYVNNDILYLSNCTDVSYKKLTGKTNHKVKQTITTINK